MRDKEIGIDRERDKKHRTKSISQKAGPKVESWNCRIRWAYQKLCFCSLK